MSLFDDSTAHNLDSAISAPVAEDTAGSSEGSTPDRTNPQPPKIVPKQDERPSVTATTEDFAAALETFTTESEEAAGEDNVLRGTVLKITPTHVVVDIGAKSEGMLPLAEVLDHEGKPKFQPGDEIDVMREKGAAEEGYINLSHQRAQRLRAWDEIERAYNEKKPIHAQVVERIKGGLTVDILGARAFLPGSQADLRPVRNLDVIKGQMLEVAVIKLNKKRGNIVVSRKQVLEEEQNEKKAKTLQHLEESAVLTGVVKNLTEYGAFVDLGGIDGLLHITDMSWGRVSNPHEVVHIDQQLEVYIISVDKDKEKIALGLKQKSASPWANVEAKYPISSRHTGEVVNVMSYGAFVKLEPGIEGLVHISEMSWTKRINHPSELVEIGRAHV